MYKTLRTPNMNRYIMYNIKKFLSYWKMGYWIPNDVIACVS